MRHAICYVSSKNKNLTHKQIIKLLEFCLENNEINEIKGILLYSEGNFFQILEGEKKIVLNLFEKIKKDSRHKNIIQITGHDIKKGSFDGYKVDIIKADYKGKLEIPLEYKEPLNGIPPNIKNPMEQVLETFIFTR